VPAGSWAEGAGRPARRKKMSRLVDRQNETGYRPRVKLGSVEDPVGPTLRRGPQELDAARKREKPMGTGRISRCVIRFSLPFGRTSRAAPCC
jgi:hypothetical protein